LLPLYESDEKVLGPELITVDEFELQPAEAKTIEVSLSPEARFVGAIVPFRDDRNSTWRAVVPAPRKGLTVKIDRASVSLVALP
jgi:type VI secretion system protein VasD